ncbi:MAG TPA: transposase [Candidatus Hydrogenedentes bacterium]|nr:transposase [Candidatus Hydrogenedentota bacterium]HQM51138.1 transposase [Candidatus Hydrogenedentota bacterium]
MDGAAFWVWAKQVFVRTLQSTDIVVLDNLSVHRNAAACAAITAVGAQLWPLPPYSYDLNPIEKMWSKVRAYLRRAKARDPQSLFHAISRALEQVTQEDVRNWFASCGYSFI